MPADLDAQTWGRRAADKDVLEAVRLQLHAMDVSAPAKALSGDDAVFLAAKRAELEWWQRQAQARAERVGGL